MARPVILLAARFQSSLKKLSDTDLSRVEAALVVVADCFGQPHLHSGISIRRLRKNVFECRAGLSIRLLFRARPGALEFFFAGNHDEIRRVIQDL